MRGTVKVAEYRRNREGIVLGMRTDGGGRLGASKGCCNHGSCKTVPRRFIKAQMKDVAISHSSWSCSCGWWDGVVTVQHTKQFPWWKLTSRAKLFGDWKYKAFWLFCFPRVSDILWVRCCCWHWPFRSQTRVSPGQFFVDHSLKHPRKKYQMSYKTTYWSIHQLIPPEPFPFILCCLSSLAVLFNLMLFTDVACFHGIKKRPSPFDMCEGWRWCPSADVRNDRLKTCYWARFLLKYLFLEAVISR